MVDSSVRANVVDGYAAIPGLGAVDDQLQPGRVGAETGEHALQAADRFGRWMTTLSAVLLQDGQAVVAGVLNDDLEAARRAQTFHRRGAEDVHDGFGNLFAATRSCSSAAMASPDSSGRVRFSKSSSIRYRAPKLEALALSKIDWPEMATRVLDALASSGRFPRSAATTSLRARHRGGVGQLHVDQQIALVLLRNEAGRRRA